MMLTEGSIELLNYQAATSKREEKREERSLSSYIIRFEATIYVLECVFKNDTQRTEDC
jgi:hypothetical protein